MAGSYLVLQFDFSGIDTQQRDTTYTGFLNKVQSGIRLCMGRYPELIPGQEADLLLRQESPDGMLLAFLSSVARQPQKICLLIDEYDHFTNELISFDLDYFQEIVSRNGWVRKFYEIVKQFTGLGTVDRIFMTGVSPVTLDSLTSGFNIGANLTMDPGLHGLMGFSAEETETLLLAAGIGPEQIEAVMTDVRRWYNGYAFSAEGQQPRMYNPDMVLYFAKEYQKRQGYPPQMLDVNIASDYGKIRRTFQLGGQEPGRYELLRRILAGGSIASPITAQFSFERSFTDQDFLSLLYYLGLLTIRGAELGTPLLGPPNLVVEKLYFDYFSELMERQLSGLPRALAVQDLVREMAIHNRPQPLLELAASTLEQASNRDLIHLNETGIKMILMSYLHAAQLYFLRSEREAVQGYVDLLLLRRPPVETPCQFVFELKYLKRKDAGQLEQALETGRAQLRRYFRDPELQAEPNLRAWLAVFVGTELKAAEEVLPAEA
ncbi:MAG: AAA family ATPase [Bacteroidia bacterium]|nr:AAA family ATPase [Bacteroidia bacterium]